MGSSHPDRDVVPFGASASEWRVHLARRLKERRLGLERTQADVAAAAGMGITTYKRLEAGENVNVDVFIRAAIALEATDRLAELFPPIDLRSIDDLIDVGKILRKRAPRANA